MTAEPVVGRTPPAGIRDDLTAAWEQEKEQARAEREACEAERATADVVRWLGHYGDSVDRVESVVAGSLIRTSFRITNPNVTAYQLIVTLVFLPGFVGFDDSSNSSAWVERIRTPGATRAREDGSR